MSETENIGLKEEPQENHPIASAPEESFDLDVSLEGQADSAADAVAESSHEEQERHSPEFESFLKIFNEKTDVDSRLQVSIDFMEQALAQGGTPHFRSFWEVRRLCLPLFKENVSPLLRGQLWNKYSELSKEARRLKEILDEQSAFAVEQIEIAIQAIEKEIANFDEYFAKSSLSEALVLPKVLEQKTPIYTSLQQQLNHLNVQASRINGLRKELIKTEMRVRQKNKFFQRLSQAGDSVFPRRKELIKQISQQFSDDVDYFIKAHFQEDQNESLFVLREEIKVLQGLAKHLTLNTNAFTQTRMRLSECWDKMRVEEKERKKERAQQKVVFKQNADLISEKIKEAQETISKESSNVEDQKKIEDIVTLMRKTDLGRDELKFLRENLNDLRKLVQDKTRSAEVQRVEHENEKNRQKKEKYLGLKERADQLLSQYETYEVDDLIAQRDSLVSEILESSLTKMEKQELEKLLKPLRDAITEKKEKALLNLSDDDRQALQQLKEVLDQRKHRRQEIKDQYDSLRKAAGSSSLDFEKAMNLTLQISEEKERLEKGNQGIQEIERKIADLQSKIKKS